MGDPKLHLIILIIFSNQYQGLANVIKRNVENKYIPLIEAAALKLTQDEFKGDPFLVQSVDNSKSRTFYLGAKGDGVNNVVFTTNGVQTGKPVVVLSDQEDRVIKSGKIKQTFVVLKAQRENPLNYYVIYAYITEHSGNELDDKIQLDDESVRMEWDPWQYRNNSAAFGWTACKHSIYIPCHLTGTPGSVNLQKSINVISQIESEKQLPSKVNFLDAPDYLADMQISSESTRIVKNILKLAVSQSKSRIVKRQVAYPGYPPVVYGGHPAAYAPPVVVGQSSYGVPVPLGGYPGYPHGYAPDGQVVMVHSPPPPPRDHGFIGNMFNSVFGGMFGGRTADNENSENSADESTPKPESDENVQHGARKRRQVVIVHSLPASGEPGFFREILTRVFGTVGGSPSVAKKVEGCDNQDPYQAYKSADASQEKHGFLRGLLSGIMRIFGKGQGTHESQEVVTQGEDSLPDLLEHPGWLTDKLDSSAIQIVGFGNCEYKKLTASDLNEVDTPEKALNFYLTIVKNQCSSKSKDLLRLFAKGLLVLNHDKTLSIPMDHKIMKKTKLTSAESTDLYFALELSQFSKLVLESLEESTPSLSPDGSKISPSVFTLVKGTLKSVADIRQNLPGHGVGIVRYYLQTLKFATVKVLQDYERLTKCRECGEEEKDVGWSNLVALQAVQLNLIHGQSTKGLSTRDVQEQYKEFFNRQKQIILNLSKSYL